jgi:hypothetical protein
MKKSGAGVGMSNVVVQHPSPTSYSDDASREAFYREFFAVFGAQIEFVPQRLHSLHAVAADDVELAFDFADCFFDFHKLLLPNFASLLSVDEEKGGFSLVSPYIYHARSCGSVP